MNYHYIFPTTIAITHNASPDADEIDDLRTRTEYRPYDNYLGKMSINRRILEHTPKLKRWLTEQANIYAKEALGFNVKLKITNSWCIRWDAEPQVLSPHSHPNSVVSGSYYLIANERTVGLRLMKTAHADKPILHWPSDTASQREQQDIIVAEHKLILFPSQLNHCVPGGKERTDSRCVLAFNTWPAEDWGNEGDLTSVTYK